MRIYLLSDNRGFTLIEALVAVAILTISIAVVLQQFSGAMNQNYKAARIAHEMLVQKEISNRLKTKNPYELSPEKGKIAGINYEIHIKAISPFSDVNGLKHGQRIRWEAALYEITIVIWDSNGRKRKSMVINRVGWKLKR